MGIFVPSLKYRAVGRRPPAGLQHPSQVWETDIPRAVTATAMPC